MIKRSIIPIFVIFFALILANLSYLPASSQNSSPSLPNKPNIVYMTKKEVISYLKDTPMMNYSRLGANIGNVSDIESALYGNDTYAALIASNSSEKNHVYIQISRVHQPTQFGPPVELTNSSVNVNASNLGIAAFNNTNVYVIWQDTSHSGNSSVYISTSSDSGQSFKTYKQSGDTNAKDPKIITDGKNVFFTWIQVTTEDCESSAEGVGGNMTSNGSNNSSSSPGITVSCEGGAGHGSGW